MIFWLDAHLDPMLAAWMGSRFKVTVKHVAELDLLGAKDDELFNAAKRFAADRNLDKGQRFHRSGKSARPAATDHSSHLWQSSHSISSNFTIRAF
jgi:hypothetical protein